MNAKEIKVESSAFMGGALAHHGCCAFATAKPAIANMFSQQLGPPSLMHV
jgi:hypothetical protein